MFEFEPSLRGISDGIREIFKKFSVCTVAAGLVAVANCPGGVVVLLSGGGF
jgi:hypothetical protein